MRKRTPIRGCKLVKRATLEGLHAAASTVKADYVCLHMATKLKKSQSRWGDKASGQVAGFGSVLVCGKCSRSNVFWQHFLKQYPKNSMFGRQSLGHLIPTSQPSRRFSLSSL